MKTILITGATGLIGQAIVENCLSQGLCVHYLSTSKGKLKKRANYKGYFWNPSAGEIDLDAFKGVDKIINLAGAPIAKRWTKRYKETVINSRIETISLLYKTINENQFRIEQFISASAIGYYPDSLTTYYDEDFVSDDDTFIINVVKQWEATADLIANLNIKVAKIRVGVVLSNEGGALPKMIKPIKYFVGSKLGSGKQWQSWIHLDDLVNLFLFIMNNELKGVFNGVAPNASTNEAFTEVIAETIDRPLWLPNTPAFVLKLLLGEMSALVLTGQRVSSKKIENLGFKFKYYSLQSALENLLLNTTISAK